MRIEVHDCGWLDGRREYIAGVKHNGAATPLGGSPDGIVTNREATKRAIADAAEIRLALGVLVRARTALAHLEAEGAWSDQIGVLRLLLEPDDATRAAMPGAEWLEAKPTAPGT